MFTNTLGSLDGFLAGYIVGNALERHPSKLKAVSNSNHVIEILGSSKISAEFVQNILYTASEWRYDGSYPHVKEENRTLKDRNLVVIFSYLKPGQTKCCSNDVDFGCLIDHIDWDAQRHNAAVKQKYQSSD